MCICDIDAPVVSILPLSPYTIHVGDQASLWCRAQGLPTPTVQWYKDYKAIYDSADLLLQVLYIPTNAPHTTVYTCVARNNAGQMNQTTNSTILVNVCGTHIKVVI